MGRDAAAKHELEVLFLGALIWLQLAIMCPEEQFSNHPSYKVLMRLLENHYFLVFMLLDCLINPFFLDVIQLKIGTDEVPLRQGQHLLLDCL